MKGKSTVIHKFFEREETTTRPTWALEYSYGRRSGQMQNVQKQVLNVWELGTLENADVLISVPSNIHGVVNFSAVLMLDLSQPQYIWCDLEKSYTGLLNSYCKNLSSEDLQNLREESAQRLKREYNAELSKDLLPFPMVIVGGKYDMFMNFEPNLKQHVCKCLRAMAQLVGAAVLFYSNKMPKLSKTLRDTISHLGFGSPSNPFRSHVTNANNEDEPLSIWFGTDNWSEINDGSAETLTMVQICDNFNRHVPQIYHSNRSVMDPAKDPGFRESIIDDMRAQKDEELQILLRESQLRAQFQNVTE